MVGIGIITMVTIIAMTVMAGAGMTAMVTASAATGLAASRASKASLPEAEMQSRGGVAAAVIQAPDLSVHETTRAAESTVLARVGSVFEGRIA